MTTKTTRKIVTIDEEKCNGCGACALKCAEGALQIIDGKARLLSDRYCDGLGACLPECPQGAIIIVERAAEDFDEEAVRHHLHHQEPLPCGCPSTTVREFEREEHAPAPVHEVSRSRLGHFPVQLALVPPGAPFLKGADLLLAADCAPFAYARFHEDFLDKHALLIACPKLDDFAAHLAKLAAILRQSPPQSLTVVRLEVPCCGGLTSMARQAVRESGINISVQEVVIGVKGEVLSAS